MKQALFLSRETKIHSMKQFTSKTQKIGEMGEDAACTFLMKQEYTVVERNVSNTFGEIDIVAKKKGIPYFFEVKAGKDGSWFNPAENLTKTKLNKFLISVQHYCYMRNISDYRAQGIIVLLPQKEGWEVKVEIIDIT